MTENENHYFAIYFVIKKIRNFASFFLVVKDICKRTHVSLHKGGDSLNVMG